MLGDIVTKELEDFLADVLWKGYLLTQRIGESHEMFRSEIGQETLPHVRRLAIDFLALNQASSVKGLKAEVSANRTGNSHHVELLYRQQLVLAFNHLAHINGRKQFIPRSALFREMLSTYNSLQIEIWPVVRAAGIEHPVLALVTHHGNGKPEESRIVVLDSGCKRIIDHRTIKLTRGVARSDVNEIKGVETEFLEYVKKQAK